MDSVYWWSRSQLCDHHSTPLYTGYYQHLKTLAVFGLVWASQHQNWAQNRLISVLGMITCFVWWSALLSCQHDPGEQAVIHPSSHLIITWVRLHFLYNINIITHSLHQPAPACTSLHRMLMQTILWNSIHNNRFLSFISVLSPHPYSDHLPDYSLSSLCGQGMVLISSFTRHSKLTTFISITRPVSTQEQPAAVSDVESW